MSRIGKKSISIPQGVEVKIEGNKVTIKGPKGELVRDIHPLVKVELKDDQIKVSVDKPEDKVQASLWGLSRVLIANMIEGVSKGYQKKLEIQGIGYRARFEGKKLILNLGFSHPVEFTLAEGIEGKVEKNVIIIAGIDKQLVGETAARIRRIRPPEPYKGSGVRYLDEQIRRKVGKKAVTTGT